MKKSIKSPYLVVLSKSAIISQLLDSDLALRTHLSN